MKIYVGHIDKTEEFMVLKYETEREQMGVPASHSYSSLLPRLDLSNHSPSGLSWGYHGSGPAQTALAILADCIGDDKAKHYYLRFADLIISRLPREQRWCLSEQVVKAIISTLPW